MLLMDDYLLMLLELFSRLLIVLDDKEFNGTILLF